jgi:ferredoxin-NADP reductase
MADIPMAGGPKKIVFETYDTTVISVQRPVPDLCVFEFKMPKPVNFTAGQYFSILVPGVGPAPFSIASSPERHDVIELAIEITGGKHTSWINQLKAGDTCQLKGPFGNFVLRGEKKVCFLSGGVGITPFMSMLRWIHETKQPVQATLMHSCRVKDQFLWMDELQEMSKANDNLRVVLTVTREDPPGWLYEKGRINEEMIRNFLPDYMETTFYSCGPPALINGLFDMLKKMGVPEERLKQEKW